jgi:putative ABC transport system substrate-binding protein
MKRREFIGLIGGAAAAWPAVARAQKPTMPVIGFLHGGEPLGSGSWTSFHAGLKEFALVEGQNVRIEYRWAKARYDQLPALAAELVALSPDLLVATGSAEAVALRSATASIPIVFLSVGDPIGIGLVQSLSRPGGKITGLAVYVPSQGDFAAKMVATLQEIVPSASKIAVLMNPGNPLHKLIVANDLPRIMQNLRVALPVVEANTVEEIDTAFASAVAQHADAMVVLADSMLNRPGVAARAVEHRLPALSLFRAFVMNGGLISYGPDGSDLFRRGGFYIDRILKGTKPTDLPIQQPTKFELVINLKTAKTLGVIVPPTLLARADEVIE